MKYRFSFLGALMLLMILTFQVHGQHSIGLSIKPFLSGVSNVDKWTVSDKYRAGWQVNAEYTNSFSKKMDFSVGTGLSFWQVGFEYWLTWPSMLSSTAYENFQFMEVMVPMDVSLDLKGDRFFVSVGVIPTFVLSAKNSYNYFEPQVDVPWRTDKLAYHPFNIAVKMGVGVNLFMTDRISWILSPEVQTYLLRESPKSSLWFTTVKMRRWNLGLKLGVRYKLKTKKVVRTLG